MDTTKLTVIKRRIEEMTIANQINALEILHNGNVFLNENKYGTLINISDVAPDILEKLEEHIKAVCQSEKRLFNDESAKQSIKSEFFQS
jgi:hypothetical protein